ncbi:hypothetical protein ACWEKM_02860 [Streptomyces sp. NPDC004752]
MNSENGPEAPLTSGGRTTTGAAARAAGSAGWAAGLAETRLPVGQPAYDRRQERRGIVMDHQDGFVWLRPERGGTEWTAAPGDVQPLNVREQAEALLWARVARANSRSRGEVL